MKPRHINDAYWIARLVAFVALSFCAPVTLLLFFRVYRHNETAASVCLLLGVLLTLVLGGWSLLSVLRQPRRAFLGVIVCAYCLWLVLVIPGYVEAVKRHLTPGPAGRAP